MMMLLSLSYVNPTKREQARSELARAQHTKLCERRETELDLARPHRIH